MRPLGSFVCEVLLAKAASVYQLAEAAPRQTGPCYCPPCVMFRHLSTQRNEKYAADRKAYRVLHPHTTKDQIKRGESRSY